MKIFRLREMTPVWVIVSFFYCQTTIAQNTTLLERAQKYVDTAEEQFAAADYESSIKEYRFAGQIYYKDFPDKYAVCYNGIGNNYINMARYPEAYAEFQRALNFTYIDESNIDSTIIADAYEGMGRLFLQAQENLIRKAGKERLNLDTALYYQEQALALRQRIYGKENHAKIARSYYYLGLCYAKQSTQTLDGKDPTALQYEYLNKALTIQKQVLGEEHYQTADTYDALGAYYYNVERNYQKGYNYYQRTVAIRKEIFGEIHPNLANSYIGLARYFHALNMYDVELDYLEKALEIRLEILGEEHIAIAQNYLLLSQRYRMSGDYEKALLFSDRAEHIFIDLQGAASAEIADIYLNKALCYREIGNALEERKYLREAKKLSASIYGETHINMAEIYMEMGSYFLSNNTDRIEKVQDSVLYYYQTAEAIWTDKMGADYRYIGIIYDHLARFYRYKGDELLEIEYLKKALNHKKQSVQVSNTENTLPYGNIEMDMVDVGMETVATETDDNIRYLLFDSYLNLTHFYQRKKDYDVALLYCQNALASVTNSVSMDDPNIYKNPSIEDLLNNIAWIEALQNKADILLTRYLEKDQDRKDLDYAMETYQLAFALVDKLRNRFKSDGSKQLLTARTIPLYEGMLQIYYTLYGLEQNSEYLEKAFEVAERSKGFVLLQALQNIRAKGSGEVPTALLVKEEQLRQNIAYYSDPQNRGNMSMTAFQKIGFDRQQSYDSLVNIIESQYPRYYRLKYENSVTSLEELRKSIVDKNTVLIEYFIGDEHLYVFRIEKANIQFYQTKMTAAIRENMGILRGCLMNYDAIQNDPNAAFNLYTTTAYQFYQNILEPYLLGLGEGVNRLVIVPDGPLSFIPFEVMLRTPAEEGQAYGELHYLLKDFDIFYSYSSTLLVENTKHDVLENNGECLGFAPSYAESNASMANLAWSSKELEAVKSAYSGTFHFDDVATKDIFLKNAASYSIIHLAMHGLVDYSNPLKSSLAFAHTTSGKTEDELLYAYEIHNMDLRADLVVLSACETGVGKSLRGEGVLSLAHSFMYAGVPSVVTTLWQVNDYTSATLITQFYEKLGNGTDKATALREAKLNYVASADKIAGHPIFWASYVVIGDPAPITQSWPWWISLFILFIVGGIGAAIYRYYKRQKRLKEWENKKPVDMVIEPIVVPIVDGEKEDEHTDEKEANDGDEVKEETKEE